MRLGGAQEAQAGMMSQMGKRGKMTQKDKRAICMRRNGKMAGERLSRQTFMAQEGRKSTIAYSQKPKVLCPL
jgi:hypothetical protein